VYISSLCCVRTAALPFDSRRACVLIISPFWYCFRPVLPSLSLFSPVDILIDRLSALWSGSDGSGQPSCGTGGHADALGSRASSRRRHQPRGPSHGAGCASNDSVKSEARHKASIAGSVAGRHRAACYNWPASDQACIQQSNCSKDRKEILHLRCFCSFFFAISFFLLLCLFSSVFRS
jgi:hypothetical protein